MPTIKLLLHLGIFPVCIFLLMSGCKSNTPGGPEAGSQLPPLTMLLADSSTVFNTGSIHDANPVIVLFFSPTCEHCQQETKLLLAHISEIKNIHFVLTTISPFEQMANFYKAYKLNAYPNFVVGKDNDMTFYNYFKPQNIPFMAIYKADGKLHTIMIGEHSISEILKLTGNVQS